MMTIDFNRIIALAPFRDYPSNNDYVRKIHKIRNWSVRGFFLFLTMYFCVQNWHSIDSLDGFLTYISFTVLGPYILMCVYCYIVEVLQNQDRWNLIDSDTIINTQVILGNRINLSPDDKVFLSDCPNQVESQLIGNGTCSDSNTYQENEKKNPIKGRPRLMRIEDENLPTFDDYCTKAIDKYMSQYHKELSSVDGGEIVTALWEMDNFILPGYEDHDFVEKFQKKYSFAFKQHYNPGSIQNHTRISNKRVEDIKKELKRIYDEMKK